MSPRKDPHPKHRGRVRVFTALAVVACLLAGAYFLRDRVSEFFSPPPRADIGLLNALVDSACVRLEPRRITSSTVTLGTGEITQNRLELERNSSMLRANLEITRAVERAGGEITYGIESIDDNRRWETVTLGISDGDSLIREVRLEKRLR
jgi:hypothetical protein